MTAEDLVRRIATNDPIWPEGFINICKYCRTSWAEASYKAWLDNPSGGRNHHDDDCVWVLANQLIERVDSGNDLW